MTPPREVKLPVCDDCGNVGKRPIVKADQAHFCIGPAGQLHKKRRMRTAVFRELPAEAPAPAVHNTRGNTRLTDDGLKEYGCPTCGGAVYKKPGPGRPPKCDACKRGKFDNRRTGQGTATTAATL